MTVLSTTQPTGQRFTLDTTNAGPIDIVLEPEGSGGAVPPPIPGVNDGAAVVAGSGGFAGLLTYVKGSVAGQALLWDGTKSVFGNLGYQFVTDTDGNVYPQQPNLEFRSSDFIPSDDPAVTATRIRLKNPLPNPSTNQDTLAVVGGLWQAAANGFLQFTTTADRDAFPGLKTPGMLAYVTTTKCLYMLAANGTTWQFFAPSPELAAQTAWAIDAGAGSDSNSGAPGSPLASTEELGRRLCPGGAVWNMTASVAIAIAAGSYGALQLNYQVQEPTTGITLSITTAVTSTADTLTSVVNTTAGTQGRITLASGAALTARMRIRSTSGANVGAITYGEGPLNAANDTFVKTWFPNTAGALASVNIANGTTVALDVRQTSIARCILHPIAKSSAQLTTTISDAIFPNGIELLNPQGSSIAILFGCLIQGGRSNGNIRLVNCQFTGAPQFTNLEGGARGAPVLAGCCFSQASLFIGGTLVVLNTACAFDASTISLSGPGSQLSASGTANLQEWCNGAGLTAITLGTSGVGMCPGVSFVWNGGAIASFGTAYAVGYALESGTCAVVNQMANVQIASTINVVMSGNNRTYAQLPGDYQRANCFWSLAQDTTAAFNNT